MMIYAPCDLERGRPAHTGTIPALWIGLLVVCLALFSPSGVRAQYDYEGGTITTKDFGDGVLHVNYFNEQSASGTGGCIQVEVISLTGPSGSDRNLEIVFYGNFMHSGGREGTSYRLPVRLPEGAQRVQASLPYVAPGQANHPGNQVWVMLWDVGVSEDGRGIESTRTYNGSRTRAAPVTLSARNGNTYHVMTSSTSAWSMLRLIDDSVAPTSLQPEMFRLIAASGSDSNAALTSSLVGKTNFGLSSDWQNVGNIRALSTAPDEWQYYLQFNYVAFDQSLLSSMRKLRPALAYALKQYVAAGGSVLLIGGAGQTGQEAMSGQLLIDQWLDASPDSETDDAKPVHRGDWRTVSAPVEAWWYRDTTGNAATASQALLPVAPMPMPMSTTGGGAPGTVAVPAPAVPRPPNDPQSTATPATNEQATPQAGSSSDASPKAATELVSLSVGGCARDLLTAGETYAVSKLGTPATVVDEFVDFMMGNDSPTGMSTAVMPYPGNPLTAVPANDFEVHDGFAALKLSLESAVAELQSHDEVGCSWRVYGLGKAGVVEPDLNAQPAESLQVLAYELSDSASVRINSAYETSWTWRNLISSVGKPPVWTFCAFVLLFGLLLGPGLLVFTGWMGRRSLLIFLVPCISLVATVLIATYEVLHEGFDTHIRISSLLTIDEPTGQGFAWSRQTYFSGWPPRDGLDFPRNVYFRQVVPNEGFQGQLDDPHDTVENRIDVSSGLSRWTGWLHAREQQQLLIGHPAKPAVPLKATRVDARNVTLENLTADRLPFAVVRDGEEGYYLATDLEPGAATSCQAQTAYDVGVELARIRAKHIPVAPPEIQGNSGWGWGRHYMSYDVSISEMLDSAWHKYVSESLELPRYGFVTLQANSDAIYVPLQGEVTECKHLVVGRLEW